MRYATAPRGHRSVGGAGGAGGPRANATGRVAHLAHLGLFPFFWLHPRGAGAATNALGRRRFFCGGPVGVGRNRGACGARPPGTAPVAHGPPCARPLPLVCKAFLVRGSPGTYPVICSPRRPTPRGGRLGGHGPDRTRRASVCAAKTTAASTAPAAARARAGGISNHACHQWSSGGGSSPALWSPSLGLRGSTHPALRRVAASPGRERLPLAATVQRATRRAHQGRRLRPLGSPPPPSAPWPRRGVAAAAAVRRSAARRRRTSRGGAPQQITVPTRQL